MPPKARNPRKPSLKAEAKNAATALSAATTAATGGTAVQKANADAVSMPPPPPPKAILEPEVVGLSECMKNAVIKTGQLCRFYADTTRLGISKHARKPPQSLVGALGHEVEKYDQLCDAIETQLLHAITVLRRDLQREESKISEAEAAAAAAALAAARTKTPAPSPTFTRANLPTASPDSMNVDLPPLDGADPQTAAASNLTRATSDSASGSGSPGPPSRRPSTISLSSLNRAPFPLKLDLSSSSFRFGIDENGMVGLGPLSPVALAPQSARPNTGMGEYPMDEEIMAALASGSAAGGAEQGGGGPSNALSHMEAIDLTLGDAELAAAAAAAELGSRDKPIELDINFDDVSDVTMQDVDVSNLFSAGESTGRGSTDDLFGPELPSASSSGGGPGPQNDGAPGGGGGGGGTTSGSTPTFNMEVFSALGSASGDGSSSDLFSSLNVPTPDPKPSLSRPSSTAPPTAPSPGSLLEVLQQHSDASAAVGPRGNEQQFDMSNIDFAALQNLASDLHAGNHDLFGAPQGSGEVDLAGMEELLNMGGGDPTTTSTNVDAASGSK